MRYVVTNAWIGFTEGFEGGVPCLYNDIRGLTTIAYGDLCDSPGEAATLPFVHADGTPATQAEIISAWHAVHEDPNCAIRGWTYAAGLVRNSIRLTREGMAGLALRKLATNDAVLHRRLPDWETYPASAQMAFHSLAWACGAGAHYPRLFSAAQARDWDACSVEIHMNEWTPEGLHNKGLVPRNIANKILMRNAERTDAYGLDPDTLNWKAVLGVSDEVTQPDLSQPDTEPPPAIPSVNTDIMGQESNATLPTCYPLPPIDPPDDAA